MGRQTNTVRVSVHAFQITNQSNCFIINLPALTTIIFTFAINQYRINLQRRGGAKMKFILVWANSSGHLNTATIIHTEQQTTCGKVINFYLKPCEVQQIMSNIQKCVWRGMTICCNKLFLIRFLSCPTLFSQPITYWHGQPIGFQIEAILPIIIFYCTIINPFCLKFHLNYLDR